MLLSGECQLVPFNYSQIIRIEAHLPLSNFFMWVMGNLCGISEQLTLSPNIERGSPPETTIMLYINYICCFFLKKRTVVQTEAEEDHTLRLWFFLYVDA